MSVEFEEGRDGIVYLYSSELRLDRPRGEMAEPTEKNSQRHSGPAAAAASPNARFGRPHGGIELMAESSNGFFRTPERPFSSWLAEQAAARAKEKNIPLGEAYQQITAENKQFARAARMEVTGADADGNGANYMEVMRRALGVKRQTGLPVETCIARAEVADPNLAALARKEIHGSLYASEAAGAPGLQKLTLKRRASGIHGVHAPDDELLGVVDPSDLQLDDDELEALMQKHAERKMATGAVHEFLKRVNDRMKQGGTNYHQALSEVARQDPILAAEYRASVLGTEPL